MSQALQQPSLIRVDDGIAMEPYIAGDHFKLVRAASKLVESLLICAPGSKLDITAFALWLVSMTGQATDSMDDILDAYDQGSLCKFLGRKVFVLLIHDLEWDDQRVADALMPGAGNQQRTMIVAQVATSARSGSNKLVHVLEAPGRLHDAISNSVTLLIKDPDAHSQRAVLGAAVK